MLFTYKALDAEQNEVEGKVEAVSRTNAITVLLNKNYTILKLTTESENILQFSLFLRIRSRDLVLFSRQIATLFESGVSALRAFNLVAENVQNKYFQGILQNIAKNIEQGFSVEKAFLQHQDVFGEFFVSVVAVGEQSGTLQRSFSYLADYTEQQAEIVSRIRRALTYPIFVIIMFFGVMLLMLVTVIPQISSILLQSNAELPVITQIVIALSDFFRDNLTLVLVGISGVVTSIVIWSRTEGGRTFFDEFFVSTPVIRGLFRNFYLVRFTNNLSVMLASNLPIVNALQVLGRVMGNRVYSEAVEEISALVRQGKTLSAALETQSLFSKNVVRMIRVGEETGKLAKMLEVLTKFYQRQLRDTVDTLLDLIQPAVIILLGLGVGVLIGSVIIPIYSISSAI